ncbi:hypothetical protein [Ectobacillus panaciterrae]|uniref:hypothetical protein n=1 Tax=Ectobacillus panaciterrae TaxID=363872 RepID=UPI00040630C7|nr:hypothetical protein [Ectobacillus panaciterrae]
MDMLQQFGLNTRQAQLLFSMQYHLINHDISVGIVDRYKQKKAEWRDLWEQGITKVLNQDNPINKIGLIKDFEELEQASKYVVEECKNLKTPLFLILLELSLFSPYSHLEGFDKSFYDVLTLDEKSTTDIVKKFAKILEISEEYVERYRKAFKNSIRTLSGFYTKVLVGAGLGAVLIALTAGFAAPFIAAAAAPSGLVGAAAINAGLAALGGGAIAAGGFGMAGGISVIVGGGAIFGVLSGSALGAALGSSSKFTLLEGAKLGVMMREIILHAQRDIRLAQEMLQKQKEVIRELEKDLVELKFQEKENKERIQNLTKSIEYLRSSLKHSEKALEEFYVNKG